MTVEIGSPRWAELVARGKRDVAREREARFDLGDIALEIAPMGESHANNDAEAKLRVFAEEIGVSYDALEQYRKVAHAWPEGTRVPSASWTTHRALASHPRRFELIRPGMTSTEALRLRGHKTWGVGETADKVEQARRLLEDREVVEAVLATDDARTPGSVTARIVGNVTAALERNRERDRQRTERSDTADPIVRRIDGQRALLDLTEACDRFAETVNKALRQVGELPENHRRPLAEAADRAGLALASLREFIETGRGLDAAIAELLNKGE